MRSQDSFQILLLRLGNLSFYLQYGRSNKCLWRLIWSQTSLSKGDREDEKEHEKSSRDTAQIWHLSQSRNHWSRMNLMKNKHTNTNNYWTTNWNTTNRLKPITNQTPTTTFYLSLLVTHGQYSTYTKTLTSRTMGHSSNIYDPRQISWIYARPDRLDLEVQVYGYSRRKTIMVQSFADDERRTDD